MFVFPDESNVSPPCAVCKMEIDNFGQSRPLTKGNCMLFGFKESDLVEELRICASCRFKIVRKRLVLFVFPIKKKKII